MTRTLRVLTLHQPWASLIAAGLKTIETRGWSTRHRGRIAVHAAKVGASLEAAPEAWEALGQTVGCDGYEAWHNNAVGDVDYADPDLPVWPFGAIVATATLVDCVRIGRCHNPYASEIPECVFAVAWSGDKAWHVAGAKKVVDMTDQLPFGDFSPGRWAWLLDDIAPTSDRCPCCWGAAFFRGGPPAYPVAPCRACGGVGVSAGRCEPIPARGRQGLWRWSPEVAR